MLTRFATLSLCILATSFISQVEAAPRITPASLKKAGVKLVACPKFVGHLRGGLFTGITPRTSLCGSGFEKAKPLKKVLKKRTLPLHNGGAVGSAFTEIIDQQGDVQTEPFEVKNYPAIIRYEVRDGGDSSSFKIAVMNANTGKQELLLVRAKGQEVAGEISWNTPGRFYFRISASGGGRDGAQPVFSVNMDFMPPIEGFSVTERDLKEASIKTSACPKAILDAASGGMVSLGQGFVCTKSDLSDAGMTAAPFSVGTGLFMGTEIQLEGSGEATSVPFRISTPTAISYSVSDPSEGGKGSLKAYLIELKSGKRTEIISVKGSIDGATTSINIPGEYFLLVKPTSANVARSGELSYSLSLQGAN
jgi:hypothetical protein